MKQLIEAEKHLELARKYCQEILDKFDTEVVEMDNVIVCENIVDANNVDLTKYWPMERFSASVGKLVYHVKMSALNKSKNDEK